MKDEDIDRVFREKLKNSDKIPPDVSWDKEYGWQMIEKTLPRNYYIYNKWLKIAIGSAVITIGIVCGILLHKYYSVNSLFESEANIAIKEISLPGGHHCTLAPYSKIQFIGTTASKLSDTLYLEGEAYIESSLQKPLIIKAKNSVTKAFGAKMNIKAIITNNDVVISAISGQIVAQSIKTHFPEVIISPGEQFSIVEDGMLALKTSNSDPNFLAWKTGTLIFDNIPLVYAVKVLEDYYGVFISIEKDEIKNCRISSKMKNYSLKEALQYFKTYLNIEIKQKGVMYFIEGQGC